MKYGKFVLVLALVAVLVSATSLTAMTFSNWRESHAALGEFDAALEDVTLVDDLREYEVTFELINDAEETSTQMEFMGIGVYCDDVLVLAHDWFPEDFEIPPNETIEKTFEMTTNIREETLRDLPTDDEDAWRARLRFRISHPVREGTFNVELHRDLE